MSKCRRIFNLSSNVKIRFRLSKCDFQAKYDCQKTNSDKQKQINFTLLLSHPLMYSCIFFKYVNLILEGKINFKENWLIFWGIWEEAELILRIWGAKENYFQGAEEFSFRDLGRSMNYFQGSREQRPPGGPHVYTTYRRATSLLRPSKILSSHLSRSNNKNSFDVQFNLISVYDSVILF